MKKLSYLFFAMMVSSVALFAHEQGDEFESNDYDLYDRNRDEEDFNPYTYPEPDKSDYYNTYQRRNQGRCPRCGQYHYDYKRRNRDARRTR